MIAKLSAILLFTAGFALLFELTPVKITDLFLELIQPKKTFAEMTAAARGHPKRHPVYQMMNRMREALAASGQSVKFPMVCFGSILLFFAGILCSMLLQNPFLIPAFSINFALLPFFYSMHVLNLYEKQLKEEMETALSIISTSYIRNDNIVTAVRENLQYLHPPLLKPFQRFAGEASSLSPDLKKNLRNLRARIPDRTFEQWCDTLIQCQDDRTLKDTLLPIVDKLSDLRAINSERKTLLAPMISEYWMMVFLVIGNIPLLYLLNKEWFHTLLFTLAGKIVLGITALTILVTALLMMRFTRPMEYRRKEA